MTLHLMSAEEALKLVHQRQQDLRREIEADRQASGDAHRRFIRMFQLRRALNRWVPRLAARITL